MAACTVECVPVPSAATVYFAVNPLTLPTPAVGSQLPRYFAIVLLAACVLDSCGRVHEFHAREHRIWRIVEVAAARRLIVVVEASADDPRQVHRIALSYHWSHSEILGLSRPLRHQYLELLQDEAAR